MTESFLLAVAVELERHATSTDQEEYMIQGKSKPKYKAGKRDAEKEKREWKHNVVLSKHKTPVIPRPPRNKTENVPITSDLHDHEQAKHLNKSEPKIEEDSRLNEPKVNKTDEHLTYTTTNEDLLPNPKEFLNLEPITVETLIDVKPGDRKIESTVDSNLATAHNNQFLPNIPDKETAQPAKLAHSENHKHIHKPEKISVSNTLKNVNEKTRRIKGLRERDKITLSAYRIQGSKKPRQEKPVKEKYKVSNKPPSSPRITRNKNTISLPKPSTEGDKRATEVVAATDTKTVKTSEEEKKSNERRTKHSCLPTDIQDLIARRILKDSAKEPREKTTHSNKGPIKNTSPPKPKKHDVTRSTISSKRKQKERRQFKSAPLLKTEKNIRKVSAKVEMLKPPLLKNEKNITKVLAKVEMLKPIVNLSLGSLSIIGKDLEHKDQKTELKEAHARERGRSRTRRTRYDAMNSSTKLILLNNKHPNESSHLWTLSEPKSSEERSQIIDPSRHLKDASFYGSGGFHSQCSRSPSRERFRSNSSISTSLDNSRRPSSERIGDRLYEARHSVNPHRHRVCQPIPRSASMDFSRPKRTEKMYVFEWERIYAERPMSSWSSRKSADRRSASVRRDGGCDFTNKAKGVNVHHKRAWVTVK